MENNPTSYPGKIRGSRKLKIKKIGVKVMKKSKILIIEDETITALELKKNLIQWGYSEPAEANSGSEAIEIFKKIDPDLLLVDIKLPGEMDGIETVQKIKMVKDIPVIYITSFQDKSIIKNALKTGPSSYLIKPLDLNELRINMELALEKYRKKNDYPEFDRCQDIYKFISSVISPLTSQIPIYKRNQYLIEFSKRFEETYSLDFQKSLKEELESIEDNEINLELIRNSYLAHLVLLFRSMGFNFQVSERYLLSANCPWKMRESPNNFLCLICQLIMKNTMEWANMDGVVEPKSSIPNGYQNCVFEFKFYEKEDKKNFSKI